MTALSPDVQARIVEALPIVAEEARHLLRRYTSAEFDELCGIGRLALSECAVRHVPEQGPLGAFARKRVRGAMLDALRASTYSVDRTAAGMMAAQCRFDATDDGFDAEDLVLRGLEGSAESPEQEALHYARREAAALLIAAYYAAPSSGGEDDVIEADERRARIHLVRDALAELSDRVRDVVRYIYEDGLTLDEIAQRIGMTKKTAWRAHEEAKERVGKALARRRDRHVGAGVERRGVA